MAGTRDAAAAGESTRVDVGPQRRSRSSKAARPQSRSTGSGCPTAAARRRPNALVDFNLRVAAGETVALLGPSGSGKSTALNALAGFVRPTTGAVRLAGRDVTDLPPAKRGIGVVLQSYALFPHMRVADNVAFGLRSQRVPRGEIGPTGRRGAGHGRHVGLRKATAP